MKSLLSGALMNSISTSATLSLSAVLTSSILTTTAIAATTASKSSTAPAPLTTPWIRPASCTSRHSATAFTVTTSYSYGSNGGTTLSPLVVIIASDASADSTCMPSGWDNSGDGRIIFSPAVCPSGWTAYSMNGYSFSDFTATCCSQGYMPDHYRFNAALQTSYAGCVSTRSTTTTNVDGDTAYTAILVHDQVTVKWRSSDVPSLSPQPPTMTGCGPIEVYTWVPGKTVEPAARRACEAEREDDGGLGGIATAIAIGCGVGIPCFFIFCCGCIFCYKRDNRKKREADVLWQQLRAEREAVAAEVREAARLADIAAAIELEDVTSPEGNITRPNLTVRLPPAYLETEHLPAAEGEDPPSYAHHRRE